MTQDKLYPVKHINNVFRETYTVMQNLRVTFHFLDKEMMQKIIILKRPKLEYPAVLWSTHKNTDIRKLERIQRIATKFVPELLNILYENESTLKW